MTETDDKLIRKFMQEQKQEIPDNGFSHKVIRKLPSSNREIRLSRVWTLFCIVVTAILFFSCNGIQAFATGFQEIATIIRQSNIPEMDTSRLILALVILTAIGIKRLFSYH